MSHAMTMPQTAPFNWRRSSALGATMAFHAAVLLLLFSPPVVHQLAPVLEPEVPHITIKEPEPILPKVEPLTPPPPPTIKHKTPPPVHVVPPTPDPVVTQQQTPMSIPANTEPPGPTVPTDIGPVETAPTPLAYAKRHGVPYPITSVKRNEQGKVVLRVLIGADGAPQRIEIEQSSGFSNLDRAARDAVMKWQFTPGTKNGVAYSAWALVPVEFHLDRQ